MKPDAPAWLMHQWPDGVIVFDAATGDTHFIDTARAGLPPGPLEPDPLLSWLTAPPSSPLASN
jgi:hypothetical protein